MKTFEELWKDIEENFDFEKVKKVMDFIEWKWHNSDVNDVPTLEQIKYSTKGWCREAYEKSKRGGKRSSITSCGGFTSKYAEFYSDRHEPHNELSLEFTIESFCVW
jgi:hypothetical protein